MRNRTRIVLADDHEMVRIGLRTLLEKREGFTVVAEAGDGRLAVQRASELSPDVVVMDITMPELNGIEATREIVAASPDTRVIALSMHADRQFVVEILKAGASGYVLKNSASREIVSAVEAALAGSTYLSPPVAGTVVNNYLRQSAASSAPVSSASSRNGGERNGNGRGTAFDVLTPREREVLQLLAQGLTNKEIAGRLFVSAKTVETHRAQLMDKLDIRTVAGLTKYAIRQGLAVLEE